MIQFRARWLILLIFPIGWYHSQGLFVGWEEFYAGITLLSFALTACALQVLGPANKRTVHLWLILTLYLIGYYIKFYVLCYFKLDSASDYLLNRYPLETDLLSNPDLLFEYSALVTAVLGCIVAVFYILNRGIRRRGWRSAIVLLPSPWFYLPASRIKSILSAAVVLTIVLVCLQVALGIGYVSGAERQTVQLPFRLAGIIMAIYYGVVPLLFLVAIWMADAKGAQSLARQAIAAYLMFGLVAGVLSTSKAIVITTIVSLAVLWLVTSKFDRRRFVLLLSMIPFVMLLNGFLSLNRTMRVTNPELSIFDVGLIAMESMFDLLGTASMDDDSTGVFTYLGVIMRINGADSLLNILNYSPQISLDQAMNLLIGTEVSVGHYYAQEILGNHTNFGLAFSPSLVGFFRIIGGNGLLACAGVALYVLFWHVVFQRVLRARLLIEPIVLSSLMLLVGLFTSEGTLEGMPSKLLVAIFFAGVGELVLRYFAPWRRGRAGVATLPKEPLVDP